MHPILFALLTLLLKISLAPPTLLLLGKTLSNTTLTFYARASASFIALFLCSNYGVLATVCLNLAGYGGLGQWAAGRAFKWTMWVCTGIWFEIEDPRGSLAGVRPAVFVGNHQTELDVAFLGAVFPKWCSVTAKKSLAKVPVLGQFSRFFLPHLMNPLGCIT